jgi:hypothetical protein
MKNIETSMPSWSKTIALVLGESWNHYEECRCYMTIGCSTFKFGTQLERNL